jgi:prepilin-type N-terminal cleavage/methylation domain-containing protein
VAGLGRIHQRKNRKIMMTRLHHLCRSSVDWARRARGVGWARPRRGVHCRTGRGEGGFTLIELLVTLSVTVIGLAGLLSLHSTTIKGNQIASRSGEAATIAQRSMEELRAIPVQGLNSIETTYGVLPIVDATMDPVDGRAGMTYTRRVSVRELTSVSEDLVLMRVEVEWADDGADPVTAPDNLKHAISLELIRTRQEAL